MWLRGLGVGLLAGALLGGAFAAAVMAARSRAEPDLRQAGHRLMARVADHFIVRAEGPRDAPMFYDQPLPYGSFLCRVNVYRFADKVARGRVVRAQERFDDPLDVQVLYGVWTDPTLVTRRYEPAPGRDAACAAYRDFGHLIAASEGYGTDVERALYVIAHAAAQARAGRVGFDVRCIDRRKYPEPAKASDGLALLRRTQAKDVRQVTPVSDDFEAASDADRDRAVWKDRVYLDPRAAGGGCGRDEILSYELVSEQVFGEHSSSEGRLKSIEIVRSTIC